MVVVPTVVSIPQLVRYGPVYIYSRQKTAWVVHLLSLIGDDWASLPLIAIARPAIVTHQPLTLRARLIGRGGQALMAPKAMRSALVEAGIGFLPAQVLGQGRRPNHLILDRHRGETKAVSSALLHRLRAFVPYLDRAAWGLRRGVIQTDLVVYVATYPVFHLQPQLSCPLRRLRCLRFSSIRTMRVRKNLALGPAGKRLSSAQRKRLSCPFSQPLHRCRFQLPQRTYHRLSLQ